jgi:hypothetical protein
MSAERDSLKHPTVCLIEEQNLIDYEIWPPDPPKGYKLFILNKTVSTISILSHGLSSDSFSAIFVIKIKL